MSILDPRALGSNSFYMRLKNSDSSRHKEQFETHTVGWTAEEKEALRKVLISQGFSVGGGSCFIATACYHNPDAPEVQIFREWRDKVLTKRPFGCVFIKLYYLIGPALSEFLIRHPILLSFTRKRLDSHVKRIVKSMHLP